MLAGFCVHLDVVKSVIGFPHFNGQVGAKKLVSSSN